MGNEIKLSPRSLFGYALFMIGLLLLGFVVFNAMFLASGVTQPLRIQIADSSGRALIVSVESQVLLGLLLQVGMFGMIVAVASVLMKNGLSVAREPEVSDKPRTP